MARGPKKDTELVKSNRGSDHVDTEAMHKEISLESLGEPFDLLEFNTEELTPFTVAFIDKVLIPASEAKLLLITDSAMLKNLIETYELNEAHRKELVRLGSIIGDPQYIKVYKLYQSTNNDLIRLLKSFGLSPDSRGVLVSSGAGKSMHGNSKADKFFD